MNFIVRIFYLGLINIILFLLLFEYYVEFFILLGLLIVALLVKHFLIQKKLSLQVLFFDIGFFLSFLLLFNKESLFINIILFVLIIILIYMIPYSFYFRYSLHLDLFLLILLVFKLMDYHIQIWSVFPYFLFFCIPYIYFSIHNFLFYILRIILIFSLYFLFSFPNYLNSVIEISGLYMFLFLFPFQIVKFKKKEFLIKILFIVFEFLTIIFLYYFNQYVTIDLIYAILLSFLFYKSGYEILKNRLFNL